MLQGRKRWKAPESANGLAARPAGQAQPIREYALPDWAIDPKSVRAEELSTTADCAILIGTLDKMRIELTNDIRHAKMMAAKMRKFAPADWFNGATALLAAVNIARNQVQDRRGVLRRAEDEARAQDSNLSRERRFTQAAKRLLPVEQYLAIWREVNDTYESDGEAA